MFTSRTNMTLTLSSLPYKHIHDLEKVHSGCCLCIENTWTHGDDRKKLI